MGLDNLHQRPVQPGSIYFCWVQLVSIKFHKNLSLIACSTQFRQGPNLLSSAKFHTSNALKQTSCNHQSNSNHLARPVARIICKTPYSTSCFVHASLGRRLMGILSQACAADCATTLPIAASKASLIMTFSVFSNFISSSKTRCRIRLSAASLWDSISCHISPCRLEANKKKLEENKDPAPTLQL